MAKLHFTVPISQFRRDGRRTHGFRRTIRVLFKSPLVATASIGFTVLLVLDHTLPDFFSILRGANVINLGCTPIISRRVALIIDNSGSMDDAQRQERLESKIEELESKNIPVQKTYATGMGVADNGSQNLIRAVRSIVAQRDGVPDTLVVLSDFEFTPEEDYWATDIDGYQELRQHVLHNNARLQLVTVAHRPSVVTPQLMAIARQSGGREIMFERHETQQQTCI